MTALRFKVPVAAPAGEVAARLGQAGEDPRDLVNWFTNDPRVQATVRPSGDGWRIEVMGSAFRADADVSVHPRGLSSVVAVDGQLRGRGLFSVATPALALAVPRVEAEARRRLQQEFGEPPSLGR